MIVATNVLELPKRRSLMMSKVTINVSLESLCHSTGCGYNNGAKKG